MRTLTVCLALAGVALGQSNPTAQGTRSVAASPATPNAAPASNAPAAAEPANRLVIPAGTRVPLALKQALSTKNAKEGDSVYAETTFPVVINERVLIPAGTYVQGKITRVQRGGRVKGRAEVLMHFTSLVYPSGYTVILPGSVEQVPGAEKTSVKDQEGTIQQDSQTGQKAATVATAAGTGAVVGGLNSGGKGALVGAGVGGAVGTAIAMLSRGSDVRMEAGTTLEMEIQREVRLDDSRIPPPIR